MKDGSRLQAAIVLLEKILASASPADGIITAYFRNCRYIGSGDRRAISEMVYRILRHYQELGWYLQGIPAEKTGWARLMVLAYAHLFQKLSQDQIHNLCQKSKNSGIQLSDKQKQSSPSHVDARDDRFAPAPLSPLEAMVINEMDRLKPNTMPEWVKLNVPEWMLERLKATFGKDTFKAVQALNQAAPFDLRVNTLKTTREDVLSELNSNGFKAVPTPWSGVGVRLTDRRPLSGHELWAQGHIEVQDEGSQLLGLLTDARPGMAVLDFCAGAGGKTLTMAATMHNRGRIVATDIAAWRLDRSRERVRRAGVNNVEFRPLEEEATLQWLKRQSRRFDRVLVDAPCSGSGTWRRNPDLKRRFTESDLEELKVKQQQILVRAAPFVKPGGRLVYATCSLFIEENSDQIHTFLESNKDFSLYPVTTVWEDVLKSPCPESGDTLQLTPHTHHVDGFFIAIMERKL
jgi:16S rRNA (cytosine967-C5)-methyltransferase